MFTGEGYRIIKPHLLDTNFDWLWENFKGDYIIPLYKEASQVLHGGVM